MQRRTVLASGLAGLAAGAGLPVWARGLDGADVAMRHLAAARARAGVSALALRPVLVGLVRRQVRHMADLGGTTHLDAHGRNPQMRAGLAGYAGHILGEALAETFNGPAETVALWLAHAQTRAVLLDPEGRDLGLALHPGEDGRVWWDLVIGA